MFFAVAGYWPFAFWALWRLGRSGAFRERRGVLRWATGLSIVTAGLSPMAVWWRLFPKNAVFAYNAAAYAVAGILLMFVLIRLVAAYGAWLDNRSLKGEGTASSTAFAFVLALVGTALWFVLRDLPDRSVPALMRYTLQIHPWSRFFAVALLFGVVAYPVRLAGRAGRHAAEVPALADVDAGAEE